MSFSTSAVTFPVSANCAAPVCGVVGCVVVDVAPLGEVDAELTIERTGTDDRAGRKLGGSGVVELIAGRHTVAPVGDLACHARVRDRRVGGLVRIDDSSNDPRSDPVAVCRQRRPAVHDANHPRSSGTRNRNWLVTIDGQGDDPRIDHPTALEDGPQDRAGKGRQEVLVEHEVAQRVGDESTLVPLEALQHVRMMTNHQVGAGIDGCVCCSDRELTGDIGELEAAVNLDDHQVGSVGPQILDRALDRRDPERRGAAVTAPGHPVLQLGIHVRRSTPRAHRTDQRRAMTRARRKRSTPPPDGAAPLARTAGSPAVPNPHVRSSYCHESFAGRSAGLSSSAPGRLSLTKSPLTVVAETTPTLVSPTLIIRPASACSVVVPAPVHANSCSIERGDRRNDARTLPVVGVIVAQRDEVDAHFVERAEDHRGRLQEEPFGGICIRRRELTDHGLEVDSRHVCGRHDRGDVAHHRAGARRRWSRSVCRCARRGPDTGGPSSRHRRIETTDVRHRSDRPG